MAKTALPPIEKGPVRLRLLEERDLPFTLAWRNQDQIRRWFIFSDSLSPEQHRGWFEKYLQRDNDYVFIIEETGDIHGPVGQISLYNIDWEAKSAEYGRLMIGEARARGKGIARAATDLLLSLGFERLNLEEIHLEVFKDNQPARSVYQAAGFVPTGERENLLEMHILKEDFVKQYRG